ncbi:MAG: TonB-dependent receptor, partial [Flavobacteriales bacterium CG_4_9_14_0_2_um_filter_32_27]
MKKMMFLATTLFAAASSFAQFSIYGTINDSSANPVVGATIKITDTYKGTFSDNNGYFKLNNLDSASYDIEISYIGYETKKL